MDESVEAGKAANQWIRNNLVALGSAAVFTVYAAGYFRTREAAERFAGEAVQRRTAVPTTPASNSRPAVSSPAREPSGEARGQSKSAAAKPSPVSTAQAAPSSSASAPATPAVAAPPAADSSPAPATAVAAADSVETTAEKKDERAGLKDGTYSGWGTSRHGDIQASVDIKDGRIVAAYISQCLTRYSCSWVSMLPGQVVTRQSADVDYVSGATQSSNAFYYAVLEALGKAK